MNIYFNCNKFLIVEVESVAPGHQGVNSLYLQKNTNSRKNLHSGPLRIICQISFHSGIEYNFMISCEIQLFAERLKYG